MLAVAYHLPETMTRISSTWCVPLKLENNANNTLSEKLKLLTTMSIRKKCFTTNVQFYEERTNKIKGKKLLTDFNLPL